MNESTAWVICKTHSAVFPKGWEDGHRTGPLGEENAPGKCEFEDD